MDLSQINRARVTILCARSENVSALAGFLNEKGFVVDVTTTPQDFYARLSDEKKPGLAMISSQMDGLMTKMMPEFVAKRFGAPVLLFEESLELPSPEDSPATLLPEVIPLGRVSPEELLAQIQGVEQIYESRYTAGLSGQKSQPRHVRPEPEKEKGPVVSELVFEKLKKALTPSTINVSDEDVFTLHTCHVRDPKGRGYFIFAFPIRGDEKVLERTVAALEEKIRETVGADAKIERLVQGVPARFYQELMSRSDEIIAGQVDGCEMVLAYFRDPVANYVEPEVKVSGENFLVPVEEWWTRLPLPCHAYYWMEKNKKRLLYIRPGDRLREETFERLTSRGASHMAIEANDLEAYSKIREIIHMARAAA